MYFALWTLLCGKIIILGDFLRQSLGDLVEEKKEPTSR
jgi:hypothetical protein